MKNGGKFQGIAINPLVMQAFADVSPESLKSIRDVAAVYGRLFAGIQPKADEYLKAAKVATDKDSSELSRTFDANVVELINIPSPIRTAKETSSSENLRTIVQEIPQQNGGAYRKFEFTTLNGDTAAVA